MHLDRVSEATQAPMRARGSFSDRLTQAGRSTGGTVNVEMTMSRPEALEVIAWFSASTGDLKSRATVVDEIGKALAEVNEALETIGHRATIHEAECGHYKNGGGQQGWNQEDQGIWYGPLSTRIASPPQGNEPEAPSECANVV